MGQLGKHICRGRSDDHQIGLIRQSDVLHLMGIISVKGVHNGPVSGERFKREGCDELRGVGGHQHMDAAVLLNQGGGQLRRLIAGDPAGHAQKYCFSLQHNKAPRFLKILGESISELGDAVNKKRENSIEIFRPILYNRRRQSPVRSRCTRVWDGRLPWRMRGGGHLF